MIDRSPEVRAPRADVSEFLAPPIAQSWMTTIARLRGVCGLWLVAILALAFLPMPMRAQSGTRTAFRIAAPDALAAATDDNQSQSTTEPADEAEARPKAAAPKMLVLKNGRLVEGRISLNAGGYVVDRPNGTLLIPLDRVSFEAEDRKDAYLKVRSQMPAGTANSNVALARWCLSYSMYDEAEKELREALDREPYREEARTMLRRLEEIRNPDKPLHEETPKVAPRTDDGFAPPAAESLGGLPKDVAQEFVVRVQPILSNKCGNASCHGSTATARNGFQLVPTRGGNGNRAAAERNLASVLLQIDADAPERSPLLTALNGTHGGVRTIFYGSKAGEQTDAIRSWVKSAAKERRGLAAHETARPVVASAPTKSARQEAGRRTRENSDSVEGAGDESDPVIAPAPNDEFDAPVSTKAEPRRVRETSNIPATLRTTSPKKPAAPDTLRRILKEEQPDPFSPDEFNRKPAGG